jgi:hypothetical protein
MEVEMAVSHKEQGRIPAEEKVRRQGPKKSALIAIFLSFMLAGLGDMYAGSWIKAIVFFAVDIICYILIFAQGLGYFVYAPIWVCGLISAWMSATMPERKTSSHGGEALSL